MIKILSFIIAKIAILLMVLMSILAYFDTSLEKLDWDYIQKNLFFNGSGEYVYDFRKNYDRINFNFLIFLKIKELQKIILKGFGLILLGVI